MRENYLAEARQYIGHAYLQVGDSSPPALLEMLYALERVLWHLEQREASAPLRRCQRCGQAEGVIGLYCQGRLGHDFGPVVDSTK